MEQEKPDRTLDILLHGVYAGISFALAEIYKEGGIPPDAIVRAAVQVRDYCKFYDVRFTLNYPDNYMGNIFFPNHLNM
jgi:hypothetical protein